MVAVKVWLAGEGPSEIGDRDIGGEEVGVLEAVLPRAVSTAPRIRASAAARELAGRPRRRACGSIVAGDPAAESNVRRSRR